LIRCYIFNLFLLGLYHRFLELIDRLVPVVLSLSIFCRKVIAKVTGIDIRSS